MTTKTESTKATMPAVIQTPAIHPNPWNKKRPVDEAFLASIREQGVLSPLLVRPLDPEEDTYQVICGERRLRAALELGLEEVPCLVREMSDGEAMKCTLIENTHREDMTPWQQAELIGELLEQPNMDAAAVAAATGWSEAMVSRRRKLLELSPSWKKAMDKGVLPLWTIAHYETLAIFDEKQQEALWDRMEYDEGIRGGSVLDLRRELARDTKVLKLAPWNLGDAMLCPAAGSCAQCTKRTGANADLFAEVDEKVKDGDRCLDEDCFREKGQAWLKVKEAEAREKHGSNLVRLDKQAHSPVGGALGERDIERVKKSTPGAVPALVVSGKGLGGIEWVKPKEGAKAGSSGRGGKKSMDEKRAELEKRRAVLAVQKLIAYIDDEAGELDFTPDAQAVLTQYALAHGVSVWEGDEDGRIRAFKKQPFTAEELWDPVANDITGDLRMFARDATDAESLLESAALAAWMVDADLKALKAQADQEIPTPKSWADEEAAERMAGGKKAKKPRPAEEFHEEVEDGPIVDPDEYDLPED